MVYKLFVMWCPEGDLNPHGPFRAADFKSVISRFAVRCTFAQSIV
jgi:hypothetical protein